MLHTICYEIQNNVKRTILTQFEQIGYLWIYTDSVDFFKIYLDVHNIIFKLYNKSLLNRKLYNKSLLNRKYI